MSDHSGYIQFLDGARAGEQAATGRLATLVWEQLYPFIFRTTLDRDATEDLIQETLLAMLRQLGSLRDPERFWPWIYRIAWSKIRDRLRDRRLRSHYEETALRDADDESLACAGNIGPLEAQVREEALRQVSTAIAQLNHQQRDVVHLRCYEDLSYTEIAERVQITPQKARVHFHRARQSLRRQLACRA
ncbi:MAG TPA: sigma-70 family RNA polymerase sigma factor [Sedimentisphaerales bacterium]|nr:sigma-70 family RNA polymerase sigma factor [Sedimentisphaerales bacterium]